MEVEISQIYHIMCKFIQDVKEIKKERQHYKLGYRNEVIKKYYKNIKWEMAQKLRE